MASTIGGANIFVKKICSLNPTKSKYVSLDWALEEYSNYLFTVHDFKRKDSAKSFREWLRTEI